ncbi:uncharacterized protein si:ch211-243a20.3 [Electrophorus electricus]|uniref:Uncharacterized protein n=1 Tax=Electrophorus electricus TaxID=8005 RepID=A0A4W4GW77_ELEEL|nr:uncharacterized protein si:ch211-243a20.3 [Electrophorus electricus]
MAVPLATRTVTMLLVIIVMLLGPSLALSNELDYGNWNYREGAENVNVANVRSVTRLLDAWGKRIFNEIKALLHSQPSALLPDYSRVRPLSESLNDLFREVSHLQRRITDLNNRIATLEPFLRRHGYHEVGEQSGGGKEPVPQSVKRAGTSLAKFPQRYRVRILRPVSRTAQTRKMGMHKDKNERAKVEMKEKGKQGGEREEKI